MDELTIGDKTYISSKRAAEITGYAKDYVGQLCREGHVEAKMVGRSWYVLESSIKKHRFGEPVIEKVEEKPVEESNDTLSTWEPSTYSAESVQELPSMPATASVRPVEAEEDTTIADMQSAWKEWFESRKEPLLESPEIIDAREAEHEALIAAPEPEEEATPVVLHKIPEETEEVPVPIRAIQQNQYADVYVEPAPHPVAQVVEHKPVHVSRTPYRKGSNLVAVALLLALGGLTIAVAVIGSGFANTYLGNNPVIDFLGGTSTINK